MNLFLTGFSHLEPLCHHLTTTQRLFFVCVADWIKENHVDDDKKMMILFSTLLFILLLNTESKRSEAGKTELLFLTRETNCYFVSKHFLTFENFFSSDPENLLKFRGWRPRICKSFEITKVYVL